MPSGQIVTFAHLGDYEKNPGAQGEVKESYFSLFGDGLALKYAQNQMSLMAVSAMYRASLGSMQGVNSPVLISITRSRDTGPVDMSNPRNWGGVPDIWRISGSRKTAIYASIGVLGAAFGITEIYLLAGGSTEAAILAGDISLVFNGASLYFQPSWKNAAFFGVSLFMGPVIGKMARKGYHEAAASWQAYALMLEKGAEAAQGQQP